MFPPMKRLVHDLKKLRLIEQLPGVNQMEKKTLNCWRWKFALRGSYQAIKFTGCLHIRIIFSLNFIPVNLISFFSSSEIFFSKFFFKVVSRHFAIDGTNQDWTSDEAREQSTSKHFPLCLTFKCDFRHIWVSFFFFLLQQTFVYTKCSASQIQDKEKHDMKHTHTHHTMRDHQRHSVIANSHLSSFLSFNFMWIFTFFPIYFEHLNTHQCIDSLYFRFICSY